MDEYYSKEVVKLLADTADFFRCHSNPYPEAVLHRLEIIYLQGKRDGYEMGWNDGTKPISEVKGHAVPDEQSGNSGELDYSLDHAWPDNFSSCNRCGAKFAVAEITPCKEQTPRPGEEREEKN
jgi:hypothetical protein